VIYGPWRTLAHILGRVSVIVGLGMGISALPALVPGARALTVQQGGAIANAVGRAFEIKIQDIFEAHEVQVMAYRDWKKKRGTFPPGLDVLLTNAPYKNIYGGAGRSEFLFLPQGHVEKAIRIEAKFKKSSGSTDERLAYLYLNVIEAYPEKHVIVVVGGSGWRKGAVEWLRNVAARKAYTTVQSATKIVEIMTLNVFKAWAERHLRPVRN